jgi:hypothetical protein
MKSIADARLVVVADSVNGLAVAAALRRMEPQAIAEVASIEAAQALCEASAVDACLVVLPPAIPDIASALGVEAKAPGRQFGIPSLLLAEVVTPHTARTARRSGYVTAIPLGLSPRLMHRRIRALLQISVTGAQASRAARSMQLTESRALRSAAGFGDADAGKFRLQ